MKEPIKILFRCSMLGELMTENRGKTNSELYFECLARFEITKKTLIETKERRKKSESDFEEKQNVTNQKKLEASKKAIEKIEQKFDVQENELYELSLSKDKVTFSETTIKALRKVAIQYKYGRNMRLHSKEIKKGINVEIESIKTIGLNRGEIYVKNSKRVENEFFSGETDVEVIDKDGKIIEVIDAKSSWDIFSFEDNRDAKAKKSNFYQIMGYLDLHNCESGTIANVLSDADDSTVFDEIRKAEYLKKGEEFELTTIEKMNVLNNLIFTQEKFDFHLKNEISIMNREELQVYTSFIALTEAQRVIEINVKRDDSVIEKIKERVILWRNWIIENYFND